MEEKPIFLCKRIVCPHCWHEFSPDQILAISACPDLLGDIHLGKFEHTRFLPSHFNVQGQPLDSRGYVCQQLACPHCHLRIPDILLQTTSSFVSIVGAPASGKSYFLASMSYRLRTLFPNEFGYTFVDADPLMNMRLRNYESRQFENENQNAIVALEKTEAEGDMYNSVDFDGQPVIFPQPFIFTLNKIDAQESEKGIRNLCLYDNAGESYIPGSDKADSPVTRHLGKCQAIFFLFDPMQDNNFRSACHDYSDDPQLNSSQLRSNMRQDAIFLEMTQRFRYLLHLSATDKTDVPVIVIVTKFDIWQELLKDAPHPLPSPWKRVEGEPTSRLDMETIQYVSEYVRSALLTFTPAAPAMIESFSSNVLYVPVSATGCPPEQDPETGALGFRPGNLNPVWVEVPVLYFLHLKKLVSTLE